MNRHDRRALGLAGAEETRGAVGYFLGRLAAEAPSLRQALQDAVGDDVRPGHVADALTNAAAEIAQAIQTGQMERAATAITATLFFAHALAHAAGKLHEPLPMSTETPVPAPSKSN